MNIIRKDSASGQDLGHLRISEGGTTNTQFTVRNILGHEDNVGTVGEWEGHAYLLGISWSYNEGKKKLQEIIIRTF
jgi:hypothetical protein